MRDVISIAFGPDTRIIPMAPPWAVAMAQIVSWFIHFHLVNNIMFLAIMAVTSSK